MTKPWLALAFVILLLSSCSPWTIRPIGSKAEGTAGDPAATAESLWNSKLGPLFQSKATPVRELLDAIAVSPDSAGSKFGRREPGGAWQFIVKGQGRVLNVDRHSRNGLLLLDIPPYDGRPDVSVQIGPVLRGMSLRDATGLVHFDDFSNQIEYADVGNELNRRVLRKVLAPIDFSSINGKTVSFAGTFALEDVSNDVGNDVSNDVGIPPIHGVVPFLLDVEAAQ